MRNLSALRFAAVALFAATLLPAHLRAQTTFDFANLTNSGTSGFLPTNGVSCTTTDKCSVVGGPLNFFKNGISVDAYGFYTPVGGDMVQAIAVQDNEANYSVENKKGAGLGVYSARNNSGGLISSDDNITLGEMLKLRFGSTITLNSIELRSEGHNVTGWSNNARFEWSTNGSIWTSALLPANNGTVAFAGGLTTQDFYVRYAAESPDQFYLSAANVTVTPEPSSVLLCAAGLAGIAATARRRRRA